MRKTWPRLVPTAGRYAKHTVGMREQPSKLNIALIRFVINEDNKSSIITSTPQPFRTLEAGFSASNLLSSHPVDILMANFAPVEALVVRKKNNKKRHRHQMNGSCGREGL